jgi:hypothetical protein
MELWWNGTDKRNFKYAATHLSQFHYIPHKLHKDWAEIEPRVSGPSLPTYETHVSSITIGAKVVGVFLINETKY